jgi:hypothetical protein
VKRNPCRLLAEQTAPSYTLTLTSPSSILDASQTVEHPGTTDQAGAAADRVLGGMALPFGPVGHTSMGAVTVAAGAVTIPSDLRRVKLFTEHGRHTPVGYATVADETPDGLRMAFHLARTPSGDAALLEAREGTRDALSVELDDVTLEAGRITSATLSAVALVPLPAFADARLAASQRKRRPASLRRSAQSTRVAMNPL